MGTPHPKTNSNIKSKAQRAKSLESAFHKGQNGPAFVLKI